MWVQRYILYNGEEAIFEAICDAENLKTKITKASCTSGLRFCKSILILEPLYHASDSTVALAFLVDSTEQKGSPIHGVSSSLDHNYTKHERMNATCAA